MHPDIVRHQRNLEQLFQRADELRTLQLVNYPDADLQRNPEAVKDEVGAHFTAYLCIRTSGFLEFSIKAILKEYSNSSGANPAVRSYVNRSLDQRTLSPRRDQIIDLLGKFDDGWKASVGKKTLGRISESLESLVNDRNRIAHGEDVSLSLKDIQDHFKVAVEVVEMIDQRCSLVDPNLI